VPRLLHSARSDCVPCLSGVSARRRCSLEIPGKRRARAGEETLGSWERIARLLAVDPNAVRTWEPGARCLRHFLFSSRI